MFSASQTHRDNNTAINSKKNFSSTTMHNTFSNKTTLLFNGTMSHLPLHRKLHYFAATNVATTTAAPIDTANAIVNTATPLGTDAALQAADQIATAATQLTPYTWEYFQACTFFHKLEIPFEFMVDASHQYLGMPLWTSIALTAVIVRLLTLPLTLEQQRLMPKMLGLTERVKKAQEEGATPQAVMELRQREVMKIGGPSAIFRGTLLPLLQLPVFVLLFGAMMYMSGHWGAEWLRADMVTGGTSWFTDLTQRDPFYRLPALNAALMGAYVWFLPDKQSTTMKTIFLGLTVLSMVFAASLPMALHVYFAAISFTGLGINLALRNDRVRKMLNIPPRPGVASAASAPKLFDQKPQK
jgi:YidC/Oxa1 family membrane protein insertase